MKRYDVVIVGGGVSGTAILYTLSQFTSIKNIALIEKYNSFGAVNSKSSNNSQTLHFGDIETNYTLEKSRKVKRSTEILKNYILSSRDKHKGLFNIYPKMVLAVGDKEVEELSQRYEEFKELFPKLKKIGREEIAKIEPNVVKDRNEKENILALYSEDGYAVDYGKVSEAFANDSRRDGVKIFLDTKLEKIKKIETPNGVLYNVKTDKEEFEAPVVIIAAGGHSLLIAQSLGYGKEYGILSVSGSFYFSPHMLNGKVYTMQLKKLPFAAVHGDPEVHDADSTRFGPTAKPIFMLERYNYGTVLEYFKTLGFGWRQIVTIVKLMSDKIIFKYIAKNFFYDTPIIGKRLFIKEVKKIVPSITLDKLNYAKRVGGTRPQIINLEKKTLDTGEAKIIGDNIIFNITPSPGASTCLGNAYADVETIIGMLNKSGIPCEFHKDKFERAFL